MWTYKIFPPCMIQNGLASKEPVYSGRGDGLNNPDMTGIEGIGPIPVGKYRIGKGYDDPGGLGPLVMALEPLPGTDMLGRDLFRIHGDNSKLDHTASHGCIVAPHSLRLSINASQDRILEVIP